MPQYDEFGDLIPGTEEDDGEESPLDPSLEEGPVIVGDWNLTNVNNYILYHAIDNEDFLEADNILKVKYLNVSMRTLRRVFKGSTIPMNATYLFAAVLAASFNDTIIQAQRGVSSFNVDGISFAFKNFAQKDLEELITDEVKDLIDEANGGGDSTGNNGKIKWVTL